MLKKLLILTMILVLVLSMSLDAKERGNGKDKKGDDKNEKVVLEDSAEDEELDEEELDEDELGEEDDEDKDLDKEEGKGKVKRNELEVKKDELEVKKDEAEKVKDEIEAQYETAKESGDLELAAQLKVELDAAWEVFRSAKKEMKDVIDDRKELIREQYTEDEIKDLTEAEENIKKEDKTYKVLPFDSISSKFANFKFDTPPVIKEGRTLIPVRAITEGLGAELDYNQVTKEVTIVKDGTTIVLTLGTNTALVNGEEVALDVKSSLLNNRTYVPLRFIMETFGLKTEWDQDSETIDIIDPEEPTEEPTETPTTEPTTEPTAEPTVEPTTEPTAEPTVEPTTEPTVEPTTEPTVEPTIEPTAEQ